MNTLEIFFTGKFFKIPNYQRDYAWTIDNIDDLFEDIIESIETNTAHYIGTFILSHKNEEELFNVVDGQQRLTTLTMIISAAINKINSATDKIINTDRFIYSNERNKLELLNENNVFFQELLKGVSKPIPINKSQKLLTIAYEHIETRIKGLDKQNLTAEKFIDALKKLEVMEFIEKNDGKAIRIFQTVNDRGKPLSNMEKAKSLLIYYSNRFLNAALDDQINTSFGNIFKTFNLIKDLAEKYSISPISQKNFSEDFVMRYHFLAFENEYYDYNATINDVLEIFLKSTLKSIKSDSDKLLKFINDYVTDLNAFFVAFYDLLNNAQNKKYYKVFSVLSISAFLYPLAIRLQMRELINVNLFNNTNLTFLDLIEIADVRVYKTRGTDPAKDISFLAKDSAKIPAIDIENRLINFIRWFMNDSEFRNRISGNVYGNRALKHIFIEYDEHLLSLDNSPEYSIENVILLNNSNPSIEHIFPQERPFDVPNKGFQTEQDYLSQIHRFGNLLLLEQSINSLCKNHIPDKKVNDTKIYCNSKFIAVQKFAALMKNTGISFSSSDIDMRTNEFVDFCLSKWKI